MEQKSTGSIKAKFHYTSWFGASSEPASVMEFGFYRDVLLMQKVLPAIRSIAGEMFLFQQDSAPAHRARDTVQFLRRETPQFISPGVWPANSPDLNPVDYHI